jgi:hypothetical protein
MAARKMGNHHALRVIAATIYFNLAHNLIFCGNFFNPPPVQEVKSAESTDPGGGR